MLSKEELRDFSDNIESEKFPIHYLGGVGVKLNYKTFEQKEIMSKLNKKDLEVSNVELANIIINQNNVIQKCLLFLNATKKMALSDKEAIEVAKIFEEIKEISK